VDHQPKNYWIRYVLTREEAKAVITALSDTNQLIARLLYGSGLRLIECLRLHVKACPERSEGT